MSLIGLQIRDGAFALLEGLAGLKVKTKAGVDSLQEKNELPALSVALGRDQGNIRGDVGVGAPEFLQHVTIVIVVRDLATSRDAIAAKLDAWSEQIKTIILSASLNDAAPTTGANGAGAAFRALFEGVESVTLSQPMSPLVGSQYFGDARLEFIFQYDETWAPDVPDALTTIQIEVAPNGDAQAVTPDGLVSATFTFPDP